MKKMRTLLVASLPFALSACVSNWDMHGHDPKDYYAKNPIENKVETVYETHTVHFNPNANRLSADDVSSLRSSLRGISPMAVESVQIQLPRTQMRNEKRREHLVKLLRAMGYDKDVVMFEPSETLERHDAQIDIAYSSVVSPRCPDWRTSGITTYSNTAQAGWGCATRTNLGLMVADPRDLVRGSGGQPGLDTERNSFVLKDYHSNTHLPPNPSSGGGASAESSGDSGGALSPQ